MKKTALSSTISEDVAVSLVAATAVLDVGVLGEIHLSLLLYIIHIRDIYVCVWMYICMGCVCDTYMLEYRCICMSVWMYVYMNVWYDVAVSLVAATAVLDVGVLG
jgi:hypothetical protein